MNDASFPQAQAQPLPSPAAVGMSLEDVDTPALLLDLDAFERNLKRLNDSLRGTAVRVRPTRAVLHRPAPAPAGGGACGSDCVPLLDAGRALAQAGRT